MNTARLWLGRQWGSQQFAKRLDRQDGIANNAGHGDGVDRRVARDGQDARAVSHDRVPALPQNDKPRLSQRPIGIKMIDAGQLGQGSAAK